MRAVEKWFLSVCAGLMLAFGGHADAAVLNVEFGAVNSAYQGTAAASDGANHYWNQLVTPGAVKDNMTYSDGTTLAPSGIFVTSSGTSNPDNVGNSDGDPGINDLLRSLFYVNNNNATYTIGGLDPQQSYDLFVYGSNGTGGNAIGTTFTIGNVTKATTGGGTSSGVTANAVPANASNDGSVYREFTGLVPDAQNQIVVHWKGTTSSGIVNGFQLVSTAAPEPTVASLLGVAGFAALARRRRVNA